MYIINDQRTYNEEQTSKVKFRYERTSIKELTYYSFKRLFDICVSLIGVLALIPVGLILKLCYMFTGDFHRIIFVQKRIGKDGKEFNFYKFRSMVPNADEILFRTLQIDLLAAKEYNENKKLVNDPRITKVGKIIRKTSIDELPQFINVLKGDMSLIGNRPYLPRERYDMGDYYYDIIKTKPGLTGYWQVSGRSNTNFNTRLELESYYSEHNSLKLDSYIFFKTFKVVVKFYGAK